jgi:hypothetical protein
LVADGVGLDVDNNCCHENLYMFVLQVSLFK